MEEDKKTDVLESNDDSREKENTSTDIEKNISDRADNTLNDNNSNDDEDEVKAPKDPNEESEEQAKTETGAGIYGAKEGIAGGIEDVDMGPIVKESFLDYAMSVIVARALPDARDGFKPVQRRIIFGMSVSGNTPDKPFKKSARIVGDVMGKYHPHGDSAIYGAMAHLAQDFATRYPLVEGHGNYGSQDGDEPAAMRYTEARLSKVAMEMVKSLNKDTVNFTATYDGEGQEPEVLPAKIPNLIVNGTTGIAVGMATNIPPHNLGETITAVQALLKNPDLTPFDLMNYMKGPDFPGGGIILGHTGIKKYFETGQGTVIVRGKYEIVQKGDKTEIVFTQIPYMVNKKELAKKIMDLCDSKVMEGISSVNDYSSHKVGTRFQIDLKKGTNVDLVLNHLFKYTKLQDSFAVNMLALDNGAPKILNIKQALSIYIKFQEEIVERRTRFDLAKDKNRLHILAGLLLAHDNIDEVVDIIKASKTGDEAAQKLIVRFSFDDVQVKAILDMPLRKLTGLETKNITDEQEALNKDVVWFNQILGDFSVLKQVVYDELEETKNKFADERKTEISDAVYTYEDEDLIPDEEILIMLTKTGYIKRVKPDSFRTQNRGGIGVIGMTTKEDDIVDIMVHSRTKTDVLCFTNLGKVYRMRGYEIPDGSRTSKGIPVLNLLKLENNEKVLSIISVDKYDENHYLFFVTENGIVKRTNASQFENINANGKIAISLNQGDTLFDVKYTDGTALISLGSSLGKVCTFRESDVRSMGRTAAGVKGMNMAGGKIVGVCTNLSGGKIITISSNGFGKRSDYDKFRLTSRGSKGVMALKSTEKSGKLVSLKTVNDDENIIIITDCGTVMKTRVSDIHEAGRATIGVKIITLREGESISSVAIEPSEKDFEAKGTNETAIGEETQSVASEDKQNGVDSSLEDGEDEENDDDKDENVDGSEDKKDDE
jgi:DNA gyrase subunit A